MPCGLAVLSIKQHLKKKRFRRVNSARISRSSQNWVNGRHETQDETQQCVIWLGTLGQANAWVFMHCGSFVFVVSLFQSLFFVVSWLSLCFDLITMWLKFVRCSFHRHRHVSCARWVTLFDLFVYFTSHLFHILHPPALLAAFHLLLRWCRDNHAHVRRGVGSRGQDKLLHRSWTQRLLYHGGLCRVHPGVHDWATVPDFDNDDITIGQSLLDATMTSPSVSRSLMRAEDEPIILKENVCRLVCRRWSVMTERRNPLIAVTQVTGKVAKFRDITLKANRSGLSWTHNGSKSSLIVKRIQQKEFQADCDRRSLQKMNETMESKQELHRAQAEERRRRDQQLLHKQKLKHNWVLREAHDEKRSVFYLW